jgi:Tfp pilus assembly PilM family ATPase
VAAPLTQSPARSRISLLPCKRLLAIDPGDQCLKLLVVEESFGRLHVRHQELVEVPTAGALSEEEAMRHAQELIFELGDDPVALALPHDRALSQLVDLPPTDATEARRLIEQETVKLSGLGESNIVFDYTALKPFGRHGNPFWVTLCREEEVQRQVDRCGLGHLDLCEVTTTANALMAAGLAASLEGQLLAMVDFGSTTTTVVIIDNGQGVEAAQFLIGGDALTEALATQQGTSLEEAENRKRALDLAGDSVDVAVVKPVLREWLTELRRVLTEWLKDQGRTDVPLEDFRIVLSGGGSLQLGLIEHLNESSQLSFELWPASGWESAPGSRFAVAYGAAIQALGRSRQPVSLLPAQVQEFWRGHHSVNLLHSLIFFLLAVAVVAIGFGTWQKQELVSSKEALLAQSREALEKAQRIQDSTLLLRQRYERLQPGLERQQNTMDVLQTLALLHQVRSNQSFWFVLLSDIPSYESTPTWGATNGPVAAPGTASSLDSLRAGFLAEVTLPEQGEAMRRTLSQLVADLRSAQLFSNVDLLPADRRRALVDPALVLPDQHFALALELPADRLPQLPPPPESRPATNATPTINPRRTTATEPRALQNSVVTGPIRQP